MSIIQAVRDYIKTYTGLDTDAPVWIDMLGNKNTQYAVIPLPGEKIIENYLDGSSLRSFPFAFQSMESTADDLERLETAGFYEAFSDWLESQTEAGVLPDLGANKIAESIESTTWGFLYEQGSSDTGIYQISCKLTYRQSPKGG